MKQALRIRHLVPSLSIALFAMCGSLFCTGFSYGGSLIFRENLEDFKEKTWGTKEDEIPGWDHVAFEYAGFVFESHPGYDKPIFPKVAYWDPELNQPVLVPAINGVQSQHTVGSFKWDYWQVPNPALPFKGGRVKDTLVIPISNTLASEMSDQASLHLGYAFNTIDPSSFGALTTSLNPARQKGANGSFTCVGFVEAMAEQAGYHGGQGFIPNKMESIKVGSVEVPMLSPELLAWAAPLANLFDDATDWITGLFDPVDFLLTDSLGRRLGHTAALGTINEIPGSFYTGNGNLEQFAIPLPVGGTYSLQIIGKGTDAAVAVADSNGNGVFLTGMLSDGQVINETFQAGVPEPSSLALAAIVTLVALTLREARLRHR